VLAGDTSEAAAERAALIEQSQASGLLGKIDWEHRTLSVGALFYAADYEVKKAIAQTVVVEGMHRLGKADFDLAIVDRKSGKLVGAFSSTAWSFTWL
jgi:hypothetical protein